MPEQFEKSVRLAQIESELKRKREVLSAMSNLVLEGQMDQYTPAERQADMEKLQVEITQLEIEQAELSQ